MAHHLNRDIGSQPASNVADRAGSGEVDHSGHAVDTNGQRRPFELRPELVGPVDGQDRGGLGSGLDRFAEFVQHSCAAAAPTPVPKQEAHETRSSIGPMVDDEAVLVPRPSGVAIVSVQYGGAPLEEVTMDALCRRRDLDVVVVRSPRTSADCLQPTPVPGSHLITMDRNRGYAAAANAGLAHPPVRDADVAFVVTGDVRIDARSIDVLIATFEANAGLGVVGPLLADDAGRVVAGGRWSPRRGATNNYVTASDDVASTVQSRPDDPRSPLRYVDWIDGAVVGLRRSLIDQLGGNGPFDPETFLYGEDVQLCICARRLGWQVGVAVGAVAHQSTGLSRRPGAHGYLLVRNEIRTARAVKQGRTVLASASSGVGRAGWEIAKAITDRRDLGRFHHLRQAFGMGWGVVDGLRGRGGPPPPMLARWGDIKGIDPFGAASSPGGSVRPVVEMVTQLDVGGAQRHVAQLASILGRQRPVIVGAGGDGPTATELRARGVEVVAIDGLERALVRGNVRAFRSTVALLRDVDAGVLICHSSKAGAVGRLAAWRAGVPCVYVVHGWPFRYGPKIDRAVSLTMEWVLGRFCPATVVCVSATDAQWARRARAVPSGRLRVIRHSLTDIDESLRAQPGQRPEPLIVMVARYSEQKDHALALRALAAVADMDWRAEFIGDGPLRAAVRKTRDELGLADRVDMVGEVDNVAERLAAADLVLLTSKSEGFPLSILEAMRAGLAVVASDVGGIAELVTDATGWLVPVGDVNAAQAALRNALTTPSQMASRGASARRVWAAQFEQSATAGAWLELVNEVVASRRSRSGETGETGAK